jgi:hypothetical protein
LTQGKTCDAIIGLVEEGQEIIKEYKGSPALDPGLLAAAQAVEHYEISRYGTLRTWANELRLKDAVRLLEQTLQEEKNTDATLTKIAENKNLLKPVDLSFGFCAVLFKGRAQILGLSCFGRPGESCQNSFFRHNKCP